MRKKIINVLWSEPSLHTYPSASLKRILALPAQSLGFSLQNRGDSETETQQDPRGPGVCLGHDKSIHEKKSGALQRGTKGEQSSRPQDAESEWRFLGSVVIAVVNMEWKRPRERIGDDWLCAESTFFWQFSPSVNVGTGFIYIFQQSVVL